MMREKFIRVLPRQILLPIIFILIISSNLPANTYTREFTPPYYDAIKWGTATTPYVSGSSSGCNFNSGVIGVYTSGWIGGAVATSTQYVLFYVPAKSSIKAKARIVYVGGTVNYGFASFSGTEWQWNLDNGDFHRHDISPPFSWDIILGKVVDIALLALGSGIVKEGTAAAEVIELLDMINTMYQISSTIEQMVEAGDAEEVNATFSFTASPGYHALGIGIRGTATGCVTGSGFAIMAGYIPKVTLTISNDYSGSADYTITDILPSNYYPKKGEQIHFKILVSNIGTGIGDNDKVQFIVDEPGKPNALNWLSGDNFNFEPAETIVKSLYYAPTKKGDIIVKANADPLHEIVESDETNNYMEKKYYVQGWPPIKPSTPTGLPTGNILTRNATYNLTTSTTDPDDDPLKYHFKIRKEGESWFFIPGWDSSNLGWNDGSVSFTPTTYNAMGFQGTYYLSAEALDCDGMYSGYSNEATFWVAANQAPCAPGITGPSGGYTKDTLAFSFQSTDLEGDSIEYRINWGDGTPITQFARPLEGQYFLSASHRYATAGTYTLQAQAQDNYGAQSSWSSQAVKTTVFIPPAGSIEVISTIPSSSFTIYKSGSVAYTGSGGYWYQSAPPGTYTIVFDSKDGFHTPPSDYNSLSSYGLITFNGMYAHQTGTIKVNTNLAAASFSVTGSGTALGKTINGTGTSFTEDDAWAGSYCIAFSSVPGYCLPYQNRTRKTLGNLQTITFEGTYLLPPVADLDFYTTRSFVIEREEAIEFDGSGSYNPNAGVDIVKYVFNFGDGTAPYCETPTNYPDGKFDGKTIHAYGQFRTYIPYLTVYDPYNNAASVAGAPVKVKTRPYSRFVVLPAPSIVGETVTFRSAAFDPDGDTITASEWRSDRDGILSTSSTFTKDDLTTGQHTITLRVKDSDNLWSADERFYLMNYEARAWRMFKRNQPRHSNQSPYSGRIYGLLNYGIRGMYPTMGPINGSPAAANIDGDWKNGLEIAFPSMDGNLYVLDSALNFKWLKNIGASVSTPAIDTLITTGPMSIVVGSSNGVYAFDKDGTHLWRFQSIPPGSAFDSTPVIADINYNPADGKEIIIGCNDRNVYMIDYQGNLKWKYPAPMAFATFPGSPAVGDVDPHSDGMEIAIGSTDSNLYLLDVNGNLISSWLTGGPILTTPAIASLVPNSLANGGVETNIVFGSDDGHVYCLWYTTGTLSLTWQYPKIIDPPLLPVRSSPAIGMVGEGSSTGGEVVFGCDNGTVYDLKGSDGTLKAFFNCGGGTMVRSTPVIANIDTQHFLHMTKGDLPEVIFGATDGKLYGVSLAQGGQNLPWSPLGISAGPPPFPIFSSPAVCDINHDPDMEILIGAANNNLYLLGPLKDPNLVPVVDFIADHPSGNAPLTVTFTDQSSNNPVEWVWEFGDDSAPATDQNPVHTYSNPGQYTVSLTATNAHGCVTNTKTNYITVNMPPSASFDILPASGYASLNVNFTDTSQYSPTSWSWTFGDTGTSLEQNPSHIYANPGTYTVSMTATNAHGSDTITKTGCVLVMTPPAAADFTQDITDGKAPLQVQFTDLSAGNPTAWDWNFGDGNSSSQQNPSHTFTIPGNYLVTLTASNSGGASTKTNDVLISVAAQTDSVIIPNVPDINQPPTNTLPATNPSNYSAPVAAVNITEYWDIIIKETNALSVNAALTSPTVAEYIGYFMDTNNDGSVERGNGADNHNGTFAKDIGIGLTEFARWDSAYPFNAPPATPPARPALKAGYSWDISSDYSTGWNLFKSEINAGRPALLNFRYWNPDSTGINIMNTATGEFIDVFIWGAEISSSKSANPFNPEEVWNLQSGDSCIGHTVTGVGYIEDWDPDGAGSLPESDFAIVHDTWDTTPVNVAIPWANWNSTVKVKTSKSQNSAGNIWKLYN